MKATGKRIVHLYEGVFRMNREDFARFTGVSRSSLVNIETGNGGKRALEDLIETLQLNPTWVHEGKGSIWLTGTDEENVARIKSMKSGQQTGTNDQAVEELKVELVRYREREDRLQRIIDKLIGGGTNFRKALSGTSYAKTA